MVPLSDDQNFPRLGVAVRGAMFLAPEILQVDTPEPPYAQQCVSVYICVGYDGY